MLSIVAPARSMPVAAECRSMCAPREGASVIVSDVDREGGAFGADGQTVYVVVPAPDVGDLLDELAVDGTVAVVGMG